MGNLRLPHIQQSFTRREVDILRLMKEGLSNHAIAQELFLSLGTIKWYNKQIFGKLYVDNRVHAIERAIEIGLIDAWAAPIPAEVSRQPLTRQKHNLPASLTTFIGRKKEREDLRILLHSSTSRLVTVLGPGGIGKTRLALRVAEETLPAFEHGVWLADLAPVTDPGLVPQVVANSLGIRDSGGQPYEEALARLLSSSSLLLVLDNCEHLVEACARLVLHLLTYCPQLRILATSREALQVEGEALYPLDSLPFPDAYKLPEIAALKAYEAVQLFVERAGLVCPGFSLTPENAWAVVLTCQRIDGIPLALELAAARTHLLSVEQVAARLEDCFQLLSGGGRTAVPRHQTMKACLDWSYDLLSAPERVLLRRLAVFCGGWTLEAAEEICASRAGRWVSTENQVASLEVIDLLAQLVNKSLVTTDTAHTEARFSMLEPIRQYALEKLVQSGEGPILRDSHLGYYTCFCEQVDPKLRSAEQPALFKKMEAERDNLLAALRWALVEEGIERGLSPAQVEKGLRLGNALLYYCELNSRSSFPESVQWLKNGLERIKDQDERWNALRARTLYTIGYMLSWEEEGLELRKSPETFEKCIALSRECGELPVLSLALARLAWVTQDSPQAQSMVEESVAICRQVGDHWNLAEALWDKMSIADVPAAIISGEESLALFRETGDPWKTNWALTVLSQQYILQGQYAAGYAYLQESTQFFLEKGNLSGMIFAYHCKGTAAYYLEDFNQVATCFLSALEIYHQFGKIGFSVHYLRLLGTAYKRLGDLHRSAGYYLDCISAAQGLGEKRCVCMALSGMAGVAAAVGQPLRAVHLLGTVEAAYKALNKTNDPIAQIESERDTALARAQLDEAAFASAWEEGRAMGLEEAIREAHAIADSFTSPESSPYSR